MRLNTQRRRDLRSPSDRVVVRIVLRACQLIGYEGKRATFIGKQINFDRNHRLLERSSSIICLRFLSSSPRSILLGSKQEDPGGESDSDGERELL